VGERGAIKVDQQMATSLQATWAAGDCAETYHHLLGRAAYLPLGTIAHKQGRIAGENAIGGLQRFEGALGTQVVKVFDLVAARTGLRNADWATRGLRMRARERR
jgi:NADPH-dependent 2,4-dienoyl-CoA reductase/sulfur reductase-like enzyme